MHRLDIYICNPGEQERCTRWSRDHGDSPSGICSPRGVSLCRTLRWLIGPTLDTSPLARSPTSTLTYCSVLTFLTELRSLQAGAARSLSLQVSFVTTNGVLFFLSYLELWLPQQPRAAFIHRVTYIQSVSFIYLFMYFILFCNFLFLFFLPSGR